MKTKSTESRGWAEPTTYVGNNRVAKLAHPTEIANCRTEPNAADDFDPRDSESLIPARLSPLSTRVIRPSFPKRKVGLVP